MLTQCWILAYKNTVVGLGFVTAQWTMLHAIHSRHAFKSIVACHPTCLLHLSCYSSAPSNETRILQTKKLSANLGKLEHHLPRGTQTLGCKNLLDNKERMRKNHSCKTTLCMKKLFLSGLPWLLYPSSQNALIDWMVIELFTDPSLFIRRRITPQLQKCNPLQAAVIPDRWADCSCFLQSNMTSYCLYLIPPSVIIFWLTETDTAPSCLSGSFPPPLFILSYPS